VCHIVFGRARGDTIVAFVVNRWHWLLMWLALWLLIGLSAEPRARCYFDFIALGALALFDLTLNVDILKALSNKFDPYWMNGCLVTW
jgi:hypothetical protein